MLSVFTYSKQFYYLPLCIYFVCDFPFIFPFSWQYNIWMCHAYKHARRMHLCFRPMCMYLWVDVLCLYMRIIYLSVYTKKGVHANNIHTYTNTERSYMGASDCVLRRCIQTCDVHTTHKQR